MDGDLENMWLMDFGCSCLMTGVAIWFSSLTHLLSCVWFLWILACGLSMCLPCVDGHSFSHSMITHEPFVRFDGLFDSFSCGLGWVLGHILELLCWSMILFLWCFFWFFLCWSLESLSPFCSNDYTRSFFRAYISRRASYGDSMASFMNQILHLANPHDKLSALCVFKSWVPKYSLTNPLGSKTWTSLSLSCHM
jgi:hypothetical protein